MGIAPLEPVAGTAGETFSGATAAVDAALLDGLWQACDAATWGLDRAEFERILIRAGSAQSLGFPDGTTPAPRQPPAASQPAEFFRGLRLDDLVLAHACAAGNERAWERFIALYRQPLTRAAIATTRSETLGRELADQLYAELYGLAERGGQRRSPLESYKGRGSLLGWLRTTLAQRHVDHLRRNRHEQPIEDLDAAAPDSPPQTLPAELAALQRALEAALAARGAEERFLLAAYYLDGQTLLAIARILRVHEATVSRKLRRALKEIRKQVLRHLQMQGLSRRAAEEALGVDPRDLDVNLKKLLQQSQTGAFPEKAPS